MFTEPRPSWRTRLRRVLGTDQLPALYRRYQALEAHMSTVLESLQALAAQQTEASAAQQASFSNLHGAIQRLETAVREGQVSPEIEQAVADLKTGFDTMRDAANSADDGYEPAPAEPSTPEVPQTPGDDTPTVPVENAPADTEGASRR